MPGRAVSIARVGEISKGAKPISRSMLREHENGALTLQQLRWELSLNRCMLQIKLEVRIPVPFPVRETVIQNHEPQTALDLNFTSYRGRSGLSGRHTIAAAVFEPLKSKQPKPTNS